MSECDLSEVRKRAWKTRRNKYGPHGHSGGYNTYSRPMSAVGQRALALVIRLHEEGALSEGQCSKALNIDRIRFRALCDSLPAPPK